MTKNTQNTTRIADMVRPNIKRLKAYTCARDLYQTGIFLDANENPFGSVVRTSIDLELNRYPDPYYTLLKRNLATMLGVNLENIFIGVGSNEVIDLLIRVFAGPGDEVIIFEPTYGMYHVAAEINDVAIRTCLLDQQFNIDFVAFRSKVGSGTKLVFCCSPNSPTGNILSVEDIQQLCREFDGIVVLDEAYIEFASRESMVCDILTIPNLVIIRTFSKAWGMAGLRVGYAVANPEIITYLNKIKPPYNLNRLSAELAIKALSRRDYVQRMRNRIVQERGRLQRKLEKLGCFVYPSEANFLLVRIPNASRVVKTLAQDFQIIVRDFSFKSILKDCFRVTIGTPAQNNLLIRSLKNIV